MLIPYLSLLLLSEDVDFDWERFRTERPIRQILPAILAGGVGSVVGFLLPVVGDTLIILTVGIGFLSMHFTFVSLNKEYYRDGVYTVFGSPILRIKIDRTK
ncbi:MAG: hypothetical protein U5K28_00185 [Halobacteriales archaeon]|nr:hypothetical protein [Halobacteriales archaeon]